ncbi:MAG: DNA translocase FtsK [Candidatus Babeliales bacterium]
MKKIAYVFINNIKQTALFFLLITFSVIFSIILLSFHPQDPSPFFISSEPQSIQNLFGYWGASVAAFLFFLFGTAAFLLIPLLLFITYICFFGDMKIEWDRLCALVALIFVSAAIGARLRAMLIPHAFAPGGVIGDLFVKSLSYIFDDPMIPIFLYSGLLICCVLLTRFTLISAISWLNSKSHYLKISAYYSYVVLKTIAFQCMYAIKTIKKLFIDSDKLTESWEESDFDIIIKEELQSMQEEDIWSTFEPVMRGQSDEIDQEITVKQEEMTQELGENIQEEKIEKKQQKNKYTLPPLTLCKLQRKTLTDSEQKKELEQLAQVLEEKLARFGIAGQVTSIKIGPVVTLFEYQPHIDSKISKIIALEDDLALALQATSIRIIAPIPGTSVVGFEVANKSRNLVHLSTILHSAEFSSFNGKLPLVLGVDTVGKTVITDLTTLPHVLIAGSTGSGKSVAMNVILTSLLYRCMPEYLKLILIDPKRLEFAPYADIPHLLFPIVTNPKEAGPVLQWVVRTMEERYEIMATCGVRNIADYNKIAEKKDDFESFPFIVVMIDELADLMMVAGKEIEERIARIAQMARAAGIHLIVATQRPSVDVLTGIIKANFPSRISFKVATKIDSRTILDAIGADKLLGKGDMLYLDMSSHLCRIHGPYISDDEVEQIASFTRAQKKAEYLDLSEVVKTENHELLDADQELYEQVLCFVQSIDEISISLLQRRFRIGYNRSARMIDLLEMQGIIMPSQGGKTRKVIR